MPKAPVLPLILKCSVKHCSRIPRFMAALMALLTIQIIASAQVYSTDGATALGIAPGSPSGSYALSGFDNINLRAAAYRNRWSRWCFVHHDAPL